MCDKIEMQPVPIRFWVHGGDFKEYDLIKSLDQVIQHYVKQGLSDTGVCRAVDWLQQKYGTP